jgi:hypothetical protein
MSWKKPLGNTRLYFETMAIRHRKRKARLKIIKVIDEVIFDMSDDVQVDIEDTFASPRTVKITAYLYPGA